MQGISEAPAARTPRERWKPSLRVAFDHQAFREGVRAVHTNTIEGYFSILKRGIYGVYQHVSEAHLKRYLCEFDFRYTNREKVGIDDQARTAMAVAGAVGKRLTYETTRAGRPA